MKTGKVVNFGRKGYGFIRDLESRKQYFVHIKDVAGRRDLQVGQVVTFEIAPETPGHSQRAILVDVISSSDPHTLVRR
jgi:cold shock CspA family protein